MTYNSAIAVSCVISATATSFTTFMLYYNHRRKKLREKTTTTAATTTATTATTTATTATTATTTSSSTYESLIGNTPIICLEKISSLLGQEKKIYVKMESFNPGGTGKDRAALSMIQDAEQKKQLPQKGKHNEDPTGVVIEGTSGSTGISLASICASKGYSCIIYMPDDQANEKRSILECLGATVHVVPTCSISNPNHYVNLARRKAEEINRKNPNTAVFMNQFENIANFNVHYSSTGPEIWRQMQQQMLMNNGSNSSNGSNHQVAMVDAFVMSSGTGGTIAGVGSFLKEKNPNMKVVLADPPGSSLYNKIKFGVAFAHEQTEQSLRRHRYDTIAEGIGLDRITMNFNLGLEGDIIDDAVRVSDQEAVDMAHWLLREEGLFVGSSSAMNVVAAVRTALDMPNGSNIVTVICDGGQRHLTRFWNRDFITKRGLIWPEDVMSANGEHKIPECMISLF